MEREFLLPCAIGRDGLVTTWHASRGIVELGRGFTLESCLAIVRLAGGEVMCGWNGLEQEKP